MTDTSKKEAFNKLYDQLAESLNDVHFEILEQILKRHKKELQKIYDSKLDKTKPYPRLREILRIQNISSTDLASLLYVSPSYISKRMSGQSMWTLEDIYNILNILKIPYEELSLYFPPKYLEPLSYPIFKHKKTKKVYKI